MKPDGLFVVVSPNMLSPINAILACFHEALVGGITPLLLVEALRRLYLTSAKLLMKDPHFLYRDVPDRSDLHSDMDACYLASPIDLKRWFSRQAYRILRYQRGGQTLKGQLANWLFRSYSPSIYFIAKKPKGQ